MNKKMLSAMVTMFVAIAMSFRAIADTWVDTFMDSETGITWEYTVVNQEGFVTGVIIPEGITELPEYFCCYSAITNVTIPSTVMVIGQGAFEGCDQLKKVTLDCSSAVKIVDWFGYETSAFGGVGEGCVACVKTASHGWDDDGDGLWNGLILEYTNINGGLCVEEVDGVQWTYCVFNDCCAAVGSGRWDGETAVPTSTTGEIKMPSMLGGCQVVRINDDAFSGCGGLTEVKLPCGIKHIGNWAFHGCSAKSIVLPDGLETIGEGAFDYCTSLQSLSIPESVTEIGGDAFSCCYSLEEIELPSGLKNIGDLMFYASGVYTVDIPEGVTNIGTQAFHHSNICELTIPSNVVNIGAWAFYECKNLRFLVIPDSVAKIGEEAFADCNSSATLMFEGSPPIGIDKANIPKSATILYPKKYQDEWKSVIDFCQFDCAIAYPLTTGGSDTELPDGYYSEVVGNVTWGFTIAHHLATVTYVQCDETDDVVVPESLGGCPVAFIEYMGCASFGSVTFPSTVRRISAYAFANCTMLKQVVLNEGLVMVGAWAFEYSYGIEYVYVPSTVRRIDAGAFAVCDNSTSFDFAGAPPRALADAGIPKDAVVRYNKEYTSQWSVAIVECGFTNAEAYTPVPPKPNGGPYTEVVDGIAWTFIVNGGYASVGGESEEGYCAIPTSTSGEISIPSKLGGHVVTNIGTYAFKDCNCLTGVIIPEGVVSFGAAPFVGCGGLKKATISSNLQHIDKAAFFSGSGLEECVILDGATRISIGFFMYCYNLKSVKMPSSVTTIGGGAFYMCYSLQTVILPPGMTTIESSAFEDCQSLVCLTFPKSVTEVGQRAFAGCNALNAVDFEGLPPAGLSLASINKDVVLRYNVAYQEQWLPVISDCGFTNASAYTPTLRKPDGGPYAEEVDDITWTYTIHDGSVTVGAYYYNGANAVQSSTAGTISIPFMLGGGFPVARIGDFAFSGCDKLVCVGIPQCVTQIGKYAFGGCSELAGIALPSGVRDISEGAFSSCANLEDVSILSSVTNIGVNAFSDCPKINNLIIPYGVNTICDNAFSGCSGLQSVTIANSVTNVGGSVFCGCTALTNVIISEEFGEGMSCIGKRMFSGCSNLSSIVIPVCIKEIGEDAFDGCCALRAVDFEGEPPSGVSAAAINKDAAIRYNAVYQVQWLSVIAECGFTNAIAYVPRKPDGGPYRERINHITWTYTVNAGKATLCKQTYGMGGEVDIPATLGGCPVTSIDDSAFYGCTWWTTGITIPSSVKEIGSWCLFCGDWDFGNESMQQIIVPSSVTNIHEHALGGFRNLLNVTLPGRNCGIGCTTVTNLVISEGTQEIVDDAFSGWNSLRNVTISESVTNIGNRSFRNCSALTSIRIPSSVDSIGDCAFYGCSGLTEAKMPLGTTSVGDYAFYGCGRLASMVIPSSVTSIGCAAFGECGELNAVDFEGTPPTGLSAACIKADAAIRYNAKYQEMWLPVIEGCGFMKATPYCPHPSPTIMPESGSVFDTTLTVFMVSDEGVTIHYTLDGSEPTAESATYSKKFRIDKKTVVKALAIYENGGCSEVAVAEFAKGVCDNPVISSADGTVFSHSNQVVTIDWDDAQGIVHYTLDGGEPTERSTVYDAPLTISETTTIKAKVFGDEYFDSQIVTAKLTREWLTVKTPIITAKASFVGAENKVSIACPTVGSVIYYTLDGSEPNGSSSVYHGTFTVDNSCAVKAMAKCDDMLDSGISSFVITRNWLPIGDVAVNAEAAFVGASTPVTLSCATEGAAIYYTLDGSEPTAKSATYEGTFDVTNSCTVWALAVLSNEVYRGTSTASFAITRNWLPVAAPVISAAASFKGSKTPVEISCETEDATIYYTTDGSTPDTNSPKYTNAFNVTNSCVVRAWSVLSNEVYRGAVETSFSIEKIWTIGDALNAPDMVFTTSGDENWVRDEETAHDGVEAMRAGEITDNQNTEIATTVEGAGILSFWLKVSCEDSGGYYDYDRLEFHADNDVLYFDGECDWTNVVYRFDSEGTHTLRWVYVKDNVEMDGDDCAWLDKVTWASGMPVERGGVCNVIFEGLEMPLSVPNDWLIAKGLAKVGDSVVDVAATMAETGKNGIPRYQSYVLGMEPDSDVPAEEQLKVTISGFDKNGVPIIECAPTPSDASHVIIKKLGLKSLPTSGNADWVEVPSGQEADYNFFKVKVEIH